MSQEIYKSLGQLEGAIKSLHKRTDKMETLVANELKEIHEVLNDVRAWMNQEKGKAQGAEKVNAKYLYFISIGAALVGAALGQAIKFLATGSL